MPPRGLIIAWFVGVAVVWATAALVASQAIESTVTGAAGDTAVAAMTRWDGEHFSAIAHDGYRTDERKESRRLVYFPLFPAASRALGGREFAPLAGIVLSQLLLLGSVVLLTRLARPPDGARLALRRQPAFWLLMSPYAFFLYVGYSESLFLFLSLASVVAERERRIGPAIAAGLLAGLCRPTAVLLPIIFLVRAALQARRREAWRGTLLCAAAPAVGVGLYMLYVGYRLGEPLGYMDVNMQDWEKSWNVPFVPLLKHANWMLRVVRHGSAGKRFDWLALLSATTILALLIFRHRRIEPALAAYTAAAMVLIHSMMPFRSTGRYEMVVFPIYLLAVHTPITRRAIAPVAAALLAALQFWFLYDFLQGKWVS